MTGPLYVVDEIGVTVNSVSNQILSTIQANDTAANGSTNIKAINYRYGHRLELLETLKQMDADPENKFLKFPLFYLVMDFIEQRGTKPGIYARLGLNIVIAHQTEATFKITDRYAKVFKPVLYPIYYSFMEQLALQNGINESDENLIEHTKIDRPYWGQNMKANLISDYVDAIELSNLGLLVNLKNCLTN